MISFHCGGLRLDLIHGGEALLRATSTTILETSTERGAVRRVWRSPHTRGRCVEWRVGCPRARESCFGLGVLHVPGGWFGCNNTTTLGPARQWPIRCDGACPLAPLSAAAFTSVVYITCMSAACGWSCCCCCCFVSLVVVVSRVLVVLMSQSNRPVRLVVQRLVLMSQSNRECLFFFFFFFHAYDLPGS
jgi:hypothetical protein